LVASVRQQGWTGATILPTSHGSLSVSDFLEQYRRTAVSRGLRPRSITSAARAFRRICRELAVRRLAELTPASLQQWIEGCGLTPVTLRSALKNAASLFAKDNLRALSMDPAANPFAQLAKPKVDQEPFQAPTREWILGLMAQGLGELKDDACRALALALGAGLRWGEIISLSWEEVRSGNVRVAAVKAKGRRARVVPVSETVQKVLEAAPGQGAVIRQDPEEVHETLCTWLRQKGVKDRKPVHYLRKCFGSLAVADHGIFIASKLLGHSSISITASTYAGQVDKLPAVKF